MAEQNKMLVISVEFSDDSDFDFMRQGLVAAVENKVDEYQERGQQDGDVSVDWDTEDVDA